MLLRFAVGNFLSFKDVIEFKMAAGKIRRHNSHVAVVGGGKRVLKGAFIFGANAGGKSNLIRSMGFARKAILDGISIGECYKKHFRVDSEYKGKPGIFQFDIFAGGHFYSYGFAVLYQNAEIESEWLYCTDDGDECIFERGRDDTGNMKIDSNIQFEDEKEELRFSVYSDDIANDAMKHKTFLSDMAARSNPDIKYYQPFRDVKKWFDSLHVIYTSSTFLGANVLACNNGDRPTLEQLLKYFDTGIESLSRTYRDFDKVFSNMAENQRSSLKAEFLNNLKDKGFGNTLLYNGKQYKYALRDGDLIIAEVLSDHGNPDDLFDYNDESDGTQRLFDLLPIYDKEFSDCVIVVDELDRSLHTKATTEFIKHFYEEARGSNSQLIATTHDSNIFDLDLLRQDEIWLVERMEDHSASIKPLSSYKPRFDKEVERDYLIGRYGAVPVFDHLALLAGEDGEDERLSAHSNRREA